MLEDRAGRTPGPASGRRILEVLLLGGLTLVVCHSVASARTITFAGREWTVRSSDGGPGPNKWSDSMESVWVDGDGLHLRIRNVGGTWYCSEVTSVLPTRHGMHRFYVESRVDLLDRNVVASPFLYKDDSHEIDIEFSKWRKQSGNNTQYVVQPYHAFGNIHKYEMALKDGLSTHCLNWLSDSIHFKSFHGHSEEPPTSESLIQDWTYTGGDNPRESEGLSIHINLWLIGGAAPADGKEAEFVVRNADLPAPPGPAPGMPEQQTPRDGATGVSGRKRPG